jgi:hypothetical protein
MSRADKLLEGFKLGSLGISKKPKTTDWEAEEAAREAARQEAERKRKFVVLRDTDPITDTTFTSNQRQQQEKAEQYGCTRILRRRFGNLPKFITDGAKSDNFEVYLLGSTTFKSSTWGFSPKKEA